MSASPKQYKKHESVEREGEIRIQLDRQSSLLEVVDTKINKLTERLSDVLSQSRPQVTAHDEIKSSELCPLGNELRTHNERLEQAVMLIDDIFDSVEV